MDFRKMITGCLCAALMLGGSALHASAADKPGTARYYGDVDRDGKVSVTDIVTLQKHLLGLSWLRSENAAVCADLTQDNAVDVMDLALLKRYVVNGTVIPVDAAEETTETTTQPPEPTTQPTEPSAEPTEPSTEPTEPSAEPTEPSTDPITEPPTDPATEPTEPTTVPKSDAFIQAPIQPLYGSLPSQGTAELVVFYVDFPDCPYTYDPSLDVITQCCFGTTDDPNNKNYPFNSLHTFYSRASKGTMDLQGQVFRYTTKNQKSYYENDEYKIALIKELVAAFDGEVDFSQFDADRDNVIDGMLVSVPTAAGDDDWWPCAGQFGDQYIADNCWVGHVIVGNAEIKSDTNHKNFCSSYLHEMGHCMGLADYYLYYSKDQDGLHGSGGTELMDADAYSDLGAFSKLMLGWYRENQIEIYDQNIGGEQYFTLTNAQTDAGNCLILPCGEMKNGYFSEYMIMEYVTTDGNNSAINKDYYWAFNVQPGIRIYHIRADVFDMYGTLFFAYENGASATGYDDDGIRLIRLANDAEGGNVFTSGAVINGSISGFHWYADDQTESVETGYTVTVGEIADGAYTVAVTKQ